MMKTLKKWPFENIGIIDVDKKGARLSIYII